MKLLIENWRKYLKESLEGKPTSIKDIHQLADKLNIPWDDDADFMDWSEEVVEKSHLDDMTPEELSDVYKALGKRGITKLRVFDFDDTLTHSLGKATVRNTKTGKEKDLNQKELDAYKLGKDEEYNFLPFEEVDKGTKPIEKIIKIFRYMVEHPGKDRKVMIITARMAAAELPIKDYLEKLGIDMSDVEVVGIEGGSKAEVVKEELKKLPNVNNFIMFDDSKKNLDEVDKMMKETFRNIKVELRRPMVQGGKLVGIPIFKAPEPSEVVG